MLQPANITKVKEECTQHFFLSLMTNFYSDLRKLPHCTSKLLSFSFLFLPFYFREDFISLMNFALFGVFIFLRNASIKRVSL